VQNFNNCTNSICNSCSLQQSQITGVTNAYHTVVFAEKSTRMQISVVEANVSADRGETTALYRSSHVVNNVWKQI